jgi:hypothetical protein
MRSRLEGLLGKEVAGRIGHLGTFHAMTVRCTKTLSESKLYIYLIFSTQFCGAMASSLAFPITLSLPTRLTGALSPLDSFACSTGRLNRI